MPMLAWNGYKKSCSEDIPEQDFFVGFTWNGIMRKLFCLII